MNKFEDPLLNLDQTISLYTRCLYKISLTAYRNTPKKLSKKKPSQAIYLEQKVRFLILIFRFVVHSVKSIRKAMPPSGGNRYYGQQYSAIKVELCIYRVLSRKVSTYCGMENTWNVYINSHAQCLQEYLRNA